MKIIKFEEKYRSQVEDICIATASEKARTDATHREFTLDMYCRYYLDQGIALLLMNDDTPVGYVFCAPDYKKWVDGFGTYGDRINAMPAPYPQRLQIEMNEYGKYPAYPAHMHIDILEQYTGGGNGSRLLQSLVEELKERNVQGVMLGVSGDNSRAISFYQKNGFQIIDGDIGGYTMGLQIGERND